MDSFRAETLDEKEPPRGHTTTRRLNDGREFRIVKEVFYDPADLGWRFCGRTTGNTSSTVLASPAPRR